MRVAFCVLLAVASGCTSVRMAQRDGCWLRETTHWNGAVTEELGPCARPQPQWVEDRFTRLVQECVAEADYRWHNRAVAAWNRRDPLPERMPEETVLDRCSSEAAKTVLAENELYKARVEDGRERVAELVGDRERLQAHNERLGDTLADTAMEVAKKPPGSAVATATAHGEGTSESRNDNATESRHASELRSAQQPAASPGLRPPTIRPGKAVAARPRPAPKKEPTQPAKASEKEPDPCPAVPEEKPSPAITPVSTSPATEPDPPMSRPPQVGKKPCDCRESNG